MLKLIFNQGKSMEIEQYIIKRKTGRINQAVLRFPNNFGASIIQGPYTYGGDRGLFELAVVHFNDQSNDYEIHYDNPVANGDVIGYLDELEVLELLTKIFEFKQETTCNLPSMT
jgi:hypothetical protein